MNVINAMRNPSPVELGVWTGFAVIAIALCMPIWSVWHLGSWCSVAGYGFAWTAVANFVDNIEKVDAEELYWLYQWDLFRFGSAYALSWIVGISAYWIRKTKLAPVLKH